MTSGWFVGTVLSILAIVALIVLIVGAVLWWRRRTLLRTPGTFKARFVASPDQIDSQGQGARVIVCYNETTVELMTVFSVSPLPRWTAPRHRLDIKRLGPARKEGWVRVRLEDGAKAQELLMDEINVSELATWLESGPSIGIGIWRDEPIRRQRRRFF
ncbi:DUF2550 family protein [Citricoccus sp. NR2]|uniref:DUF2550 family protein n=1 Tax=Citricoccus sp. NR2 TaxID=3004095 RepID=UPI0022DE0B10|nr:DUF2550 family protein [Citricoccus sp. NR2]WBL18626.1 DUF2550 family protein [Citricoccus sp. NR2]